MDKPLTRVLVLTLAPLVATDLCAQRGGGGGGGKKGGGTPTELHRREPGYAVWSPDDTRILFSVNSDCSDRCRTLALIDPVGNGRRSRITKMFVVHDHGHNLIVGSTGSATWRQ